MPRGDVPSFKRRVQNPKLPKCNPKHPQFLFVVLCEGEIGKLVFDDLSTLLSETFKKLLSVSFSSAKLGVSHLVGFGFVT